MEPRDGGTACDVKHAVLIFLQQIDGARGEKRRIRRRADMVLDHFDGLAVPCSAEHQFDEVASVGSDAAGSENAAGTYDKGAVQVCLRVQLARELGNRIGAQRMRCIVLTIWPLSQAVEDIIRRIVDQLRVELATGEREIA